jgi:hypothetical protein
LWSFLWELCKKSKRSETVTHLDLGEKTDPSMLSTRKGRLVNYPNFPEKLSVLVESKKGDGYRLDLPPEQIRIFHEGLDGQPSEWIG